MTLINLERDGNVLIARMTHGKANSLNHAVLQELDQVIRAAAIDDGVGALVLASGVPAFFSAGFDVGEVFRYDGDQMASFFGTFIDVYEGLQKLPIGAVAAISGHAYAGGAILALACDWRIMADGPVGFALNEINVGISLPYGISRMVVDLLGTGFARQLLLTGDPVDPQTAARIGLVHQTCPSEQVLDQALARARTFADKPRGTFAAIKGQILGSTGGLASSDRDQLDDFIREWETEESKSARRRLLEKMSAK